MSYPYELVHFLVVSMFLTDAIRSYYETCYDNLQIDIYLQMELTILPTLGFCPYVAPFEV